MNKYLELTKPTIMSLVIFTGATALVVEGSMLDDPIKFVLFLVGLYLTGGCANALNQYLERDIDARMGRTAARRPLPLGKITPMQALIFTVVIGVVGVAILYFFFNFLTAALSLGTIIFYGLLYTLILKPTTAQNIVIGGAAGAAAPLGAWAAATGSTGLTAWLMFGIIFLWTPPHFWALAIAFKGDYKMVGLPMMPVVVGDRATLKRILVYSVLLVISTLLFGWLIGGWLYTTIALGLGAIFLAKVIKIVASGDVSQIKSLFHFSIIYLFGLFGGMIVDSLLN